MTQPDPTYTKLLALVCQEPENHHRKIVLAEYLEDSDPELSEAWLWCAELGLCPVSPRGNPFWSNADEWHFTKDGDEVPKEVYLRLSLKTHVGCTSTYVSIAEAYRDLITAYVAARRTGLLESI